MAVPSMFNFALPPLTESAQRQLYVEMEQQRQQIEETGSNVEGDGSMRSEGSPGGILRDPLVQKGLALIVGAFVGGGISYLVFGRKRGE